MALIAIVPFQSEYLPGTHPFDRSMAAIEANRLEQFSRAAYNLARSDPARSGDLAEADMLLPTGYSAGFYPYRARVEGDYLYVWQTDPTAVATRTSLVFPDADVSVDVGTSYADRIDFRDGSTTPRLPGLPYPNLIVRIHL